MNFCYLTETKNEFNNFMANILIPNIYNDIYLMLEKSIELFDKLKREHKEKDTSVTEIFVMMLKSKAELNQYEIESEYNRIKGTSGCSDWFDNLIKASFKSYVLFLTWNAETKTSKYADNKFIEDIQIKDFVHRTFIESCNYFVTNPEIVMKKTLKREIYGIINVCIENAIRYMLPYNELLQEYLQIDFNKQSEEERDLERVKEMVNDILKGKPLYRESAPTPFIPLVGISDNETNGERISEVDEFIKNNKSEPVNIVQNSSEPTIYIEENITLGSSNVVKPIDEKMVIDVIAPVHAPTPIPSQPNIIAIMNSSEPITRSEIKVKEVEDILNGGNGLTKTHGIAIHSDSIKSPKVAQKLTKPAPRKINVVRSNKTAKNETMDAFFSGMVK